MENEKNKAHVAHSGACYYIWIVSDIKARVGDLKSKYDLGVAYEKGNGIRNFDEALKWYREAAEGDYIAAQYKLGVF